ncbi:unnamed protein product [Microthlaspi erraticum]|uniref:Uncharacterized protein n=1 Tax=Microthlaspi erraticum TaxID=1685480 RepID=A0A6D2KB24_9BRAS|nr:unnamed protein product [Microthlaspi erraticum]
MCQHVGTWSPQSPWRREHCSALGTWEFFSSSWALLLNLLHRFILVTLLHSLQPMIHLFSFLFTLSLITSFFTWRAISLLLNKVHSNLKLPLLTLTTNGSFLFLVSFPPSISHSQTLPQSTHTPLHQTLPSLIISPNRLAS